MGPEHRKGYLFNNLFRTLRLVCCKVYSICIFSFLRILPRMPRFWQKPVAPNQAGSVGEPTPQNCTTCLTCQTEMHDVHIFNWSEAIFHWPKMLFAKHSPIITSNLTCHPNLQFVHLFDKSLPFHHEFCSCLKWSFTLSPTWILPFQGQGLDHHKCETIYRLQAHGGHLMAIIQDIDEIIFGDNRNREAGLQENILRQNESI